MEKTAVSYTHLPDRSGDMVITKDIMSVGKLTIAQVMEGTISDVYKRQRYACARYV